MVEIHEKENEMLVDTQTNDTQRVGTDNNSQETTSESSEVQSSRRVTRSQTGRVAKRRQPDDAAPEPKKRGSTSSKKQKTPSRPDPPAEEEVKESTPASSAPPAPEDVASDAHPENAGDPAPAASRITFLEVSTVAGDQGERRMSRSRAFLPVPVPNLTKKSRGRRVPTTQALDPNSSQPDKRLYVCKVEGCGKCFHRGEHLKRHIRSIHTHEKPFKCTFAQCEKYFNRHDNLLQHLKVHKAAKTARPQKSSSSNSELGTPPPTSTSQHQDPDSPGSEAPDSPVVARPRTIYDQQPSLYSSYANAAPFESPVDPMRSLANMAVSSLRTEIPQSPTETRPSYPWQRAEYSKDQLTY